MRLQAVWPDGPPAAPHVERRPAPSAELVSVLAVTRMEPAVRPVARPPPVLTVEPERLVPVLERHAALRVPPVHGPQAVQEAWLGAARASRRPVLQDGLPAAQQQAHALAADRGVRRLHHRRVDHLRHPEDVAAVLRHLRADAQPGRDAARHQALRLVRVERAMSESERYAAPAPMP